MVGAHVAVAPLAADHAAALHDAFAGDDGTWDYMPYGPFDAAGYADWVAEKVVSADPLFVALVDGDGPAGVASWLRIDRPNGVVEIGHIALSPRLRRTRAATEALHLMIDAPFAAGFRRVEWKCNARNAGSRRAAARLGFGYEGTFRQHMVIKGRNRDSAWFSILDAEWPRLRAAHRAWLDDANFDADGRQRRSLSEMTG
ncbi:GNAT family N-acetyltransferase [Jannaschia sp. Os4]|nr:GNAT family N-acetyltransferase [Jannaschia sp. Os4]